MISKALIGTCLVLLASVSRGVAQAETPVSTCQRIVDPGRYALITDLAGAPIEVSVEAELAEPYTGKRALGHTCIEITASDVTLDCQGHTFTGTGEESSDTTGIYITGSPEAPLSNVGIENCVITDYQFGLYAAHFQGGRIFNNEARRNNGTGFYLIGLSDVAVTDNTAEGNDPDGILLIGSQGVAVSNNVAFYNRMRGITFEGCQGCLASQNESHSHGVLGFAVYASRNMTLEENIAHDNRYHGFAILHEAGSATFLGNESYANEGSGLFVQGSRDNYFANNLSHDNELDGITLLDDSQSNTFENNSLSDNAGYGVFSDEAINPAAFASNTFAGNGLGDTGSSAPDTIDRCRYNGFGPEGPCDPVFEGGPNLNDPQTAGTTEAPSPGPGDGGTVIHNARIVGDPIYYPAMGDLWMPTWADDDRLYLTWGDGSGYTEGYPVGYPAYESTDLITANRCEEREVYTLENEGYFPCWLWCNVFDCGADYSYPPVPLTDAGVVALMGSVPDFTGASIVSIDVPTGEPFFLAGPGGTLDVTGRNDKPASLLFVDGRLYFAGYSPASNPTLGYVAYSDDYGQTWTEVPNSPWGESSNFRTLMFINMGQNYELNQDGYVYALGAGIDEGLQQGSLYLARVPVDRVADYSAYQYFSRIDGNAPQWSAQESDAVPLDILSTIGQGSAMYHAGTGRYLFLTGIKDYFPADGEPFGYGGLFEAPQPWGPWTQVAELCFQPECDDGSANPLWTDRNAPDRTEPGKYIPGLIPKDAGPNHVYFTIAGGNIHYQLQIGRLEWDTASSAAQEG